MLPPLAASGRRKRVIGFGNSAGPQREFRDRQVESSLVGSALVERLPLKVAVVCVGPRALPPQHTFPFQAAVLPDPATPQREQGSRSLNRAERPVAVVEAPHAPRNTRDGCRSQNFRMNQN